MTLMSCAGCVVSLRDVAVAGVDEPLSRRLGDYEYSPQWGVLLDQLWVS
jgi:hypothetical protein